MDLRVRTLALGHEPFGEKAPLESQLGVDFLFLRVGPDVLDARGDGHGESPVARLSFTSLRNQTMASPGERLREEASELTPARDGALHVTKLRESQSGIVIGHSALGSDRFRQVAEHLPLAPAVSEEETSAARGDYRVVLEAEKGHPSQRAGTAILHDTRLSPATYPR